jgi:hypothetical protein
MFEFIKQILLAFLIPINLALVCIFAGHILMNGYSDCDHIFRQPCASNARVLIRDVIAYSTIVLVLLSFFLPTILVLRKRSLDSDKKNEFSPPNDPF